MELTQSLHRNWRFLRGAVREKWGQITDSDIDRIAGQHDQLVAVLEERYSISKDEAISAINEWADATDSPATAEAWNYVREHWDTLQPSFKQEFGLATASTLLETGGDRAELSQLMMNEFELSEAHAQELIDRWSGRIYKFYESQSNGTQN